MTDWRTSLYNYLKKHAPDVLTTDDFRQLVALHSKTELQETVGQRTADGYLKELIQRGDLQLLAGKGVFCNKLGLGREMGKREALGVINNIHSNALNIFAGPRAVCENLDEDGPHCIFIGVNRTTIHTGLLGHKAAMPEEPLQNATKKVHDDWVEYMKGFAFVQGCNRNWIGLIDELPTTIQSFSTFGPDGDISTRSQINVTTAGPELALALLATSASGRHRYPTNESVEIKKVRGTVLDLEVYNPLIDEWASAKVDVRNLAKIYQEHDSISEEANVRIRGLNRISTANSPKLVDTLLSMQLSKNAANTLTESLDGLDIPIVPDYQGLDQSADLFGNQTFDIPDIPSPKK